MSPVGATTTGHAADKTVRYASIAFAVALVLIAVYCRVRLLSVPLERDEGGFAYIGQQLLRGVPPYESGNMKALAGIHFAYAFIMSIFGESIRGIHAGLLGITLTNTIFLFFLARRLLDLEGALITAGFYTYLATSQTVLGAFAHATHFVILFVLAGTITLLRGIDRERPLLLLGSGVCFGLAVLMKQHGLFFSLFAVSYLAWSRHSRKLPVAGSIMVLLAGMALPYGITCLYMLSRGVFREFWFWTFTYSLTYAGENSLARGMNYLRLVANIAAPYLKPVWLLAAMGLALSWHQIRRHEHAFVIGLLIASILAVVPGFMFYRHYFVMLIPALSLLSGIAFTTGGAALAPALGSKGRILALAVVMLVAAAGIYLERQYLFIQSPEAVSRTLYSVSPFVESVVIARYLRENSDPGATIAVIGSEPQICFYAGRNSATDYLYMYSLDSPHRYVGRMQEEMIREIERSAPQYIVFVSVFSSWFNTAVSNRIINWTDNYLTSYCQVGLVEMAAEREPVYYWGTDAEGRQSATTEYVAIFRRSW